MYWFRVENPWAFLLWLACAALWSLGGWLIATHAFRLERGERLLLGLGVGLGCYLWLVNLLGHWLSPSCTFILCSLFVALIGLAYAWHGSRPLLDPGDLQAWRWLLLGFALVWLFSRTARGMAIFDDRKNLSIVSTMAAGDIPPHHYMNAMATFAYHYGFQLLGASLVRLGGLLPWSAYDLSKALNGAYLCLLLLLLAKRYTSNLWGWLTVIAAGLFSSGTRYLLLLLPERLMTRLDAHITIRSVDEMVGVPLSQAIRQTVLLQDGPPAAIPYAYMNGIGWPMIMGMNAGPSAFALVIILLVWLLAVRPKHTSAWLVLTVLMAHLALTWESSYGLMFIASMLLGVYVLAKKPARLEGALKGFLVAALISLPLALLQGGTITEFVRGWLTSASSSWESASIEGFSLRWPPAVYSGHLGALSLSSPADLLVAFFELGPIVIFAPGITYWVWRRLQKVDWFCSIVVLSAWLGVLLPIFFSFEYDRDIVRFTKHGLLIWALILALMLWDAKAVRGRFWRSLAVFVLVLTIFGGVVIAGTELTAASQTLLTEKGITALDARLAAQVWDILPQGVLVFDAYTWRAAMLTGRPTRVISSNKSFDYEYSEEWQALRANPSPEAMLQNGFRYVYLDGAWWEELSPTSRASLSNPCIQVVAEQSDGEDFRRLLDLAGCQP